MGKDIYNTGDIYVAAMLRTAGLKFLGATRDGSRGVFKFEDSPERERLIRDFYSGVLIQNVREYVDHWVNFKKLVDNL